MNTRNTRGKKTQGKRKEEKIGKRKEGNKKIKGCGNKTKMCVVYNTVKLQTPGYVNYFKIICMFNYFKIDNNYFIIF